jgi:AGZA family xanthine/uracil permease-like MFS transporter
MVSWFGGVRYPRGLPAGLVAIIVGMAIAWGAAALGFPEIGGMSGGKLLESFASFGFSIPVPAIDHVFSGFEFLGFILVTAIPFGVYDLVEAMDNVESAEAAGDSYSTTEALAAEGTISLIGTLLGSPFANAVYIGHPGWKSMGGRIGYSAATGVFVLVLAWFGILAVFLNLVPVAAISPILLYIGMLIGAQAFQTTPMKHAPAIVLGLVPHLAAWAKVQIDGALGAAQAQVTPELIAAMKTNGVLYEGLGLLGNGAILSGLVLAAIGVFVIERKLEIAAAFAGAGAVLTFFGFMHGPEVGFAVTPMVAAAYAIVAVFLYFCAKLETAPEAEGDLSAAPQPAE